jgi:sugar phosphate isomerase/epimerase
MRKIGINIGLKRGLDIEEAIKKLKELGFDCVFTGVPAVKQIPQIARALAENGLEWETMHAPFGHMNDMWLEGEAGEIMLRELLNCVDSCVLGGVKIAVVHLSSGDNAPPVTDIGRRRFTELVEYAATKGVTIAFENQRKVANIAWAFENFESCDNVGFCWDCGHEACFTLGREYMPLFGHKLVCTHIHDNFKEFNGDAHLIPFDGKIDFNRFAELINKYEYKGPLTLEVIAGNSNLYDDISVDAYLEKAAEAIKKLRAMVDGE